MTHEQIMDVSDFQGPQEGKAVIQGEITDFGARIAPGTKPMENQYVLPIRTADGRITDIRAMRLVSWRKDIGDMAEKIVEVRVPRKDLRALTGRRA